MATLTICKRWILPTIFLMLVTTGTTSKDVHGGQSEVVDKSIESLNKILDETINIYKHAKSKNKQND